MSCEGAQRKSGGKVDKDVKFEPRGTMETRYSSRGFFMSFLAVLLTSNLFVSVYILSKHFRGKEPKIILITGGGSRD